MRYKLNTDVIEIPDILIESEDLFDLKDLIAHKILVSVEEKKCCEECLPLHAGLRCMDRSCPCHKDNPTTDKEEWEEELRERSFAYKSGFVSENDFGNLVGFIRNLLQKSRKDWLREEIERLERMKRDRGGLPYKVYAKEDAIYNEALSDIQDHYKKELNQK